MILKDANMDDVKIGDKVLNLAAKGNDEDKVFVLDKITDKYIKGCLVNYIAECVSCKSGNKISFYVSRFNLSLRNLVLK